MDDKKGNAREIPMECSYCTGVATHYRPFCEEHARGDVVPIPRTSGTVPDTLERKCLGCGRTWTGGGGCPRDCPSGVGIESCPTRAVPRGLCEHGHANVQGVPHCWECHRRAVNNMSCLVVWLQDRIADTRELTDLKGQPFWDGRRTALERALGFVRGWDLSTPRQTELTQENAEQCFHEGWLTGMGLAAGIVRGDGHEETAKRIDGVVKHCPNDGSAVPDKDWPAKARLALDFINAADDEAGQLGAVEKALRWASGQRTKILPNASHFTSMANRPKPGMGQGIVIGCEHCDSDLGPCEEHSYDANGIEEVIKAENDAKGEGPSVTQAAERLLAAMELAWDSTTGAYESGQFMMEIISLQNALRRA